VPDRTDSAPSSEVLGPWPQVTNLTRRYDHGMPWCVNAGGHPDSGADGHPDSNRHIPTNECRTPSAFLDGAAAELHGPPVGLELYAATSYRFGAPRADSPRGPARLVFDFFEDADDGLRSRFSLPLGEALLLARQIVRLVDLVTA
jgi:hypothetical protein